MIAAMRAGRALPAILALAFVLRVAVAFWPVIHHADELWQYLEAAYHLGVGPWVQTWEARAGARGWLLPWLLAGPVAAGRALAAASLLDLILPRLLCALLSTGAVWAAWRIGRTASRAHGLLAAFVAATWFEIAYFGPRTLSEPVATNLILVAAAIALQRTPRRLAVVGLLLGVASVIRFQYAPAALVIACAAAGWRWRDWAALAAGGVGALALGAAADLAAGAVPYAWLWRNVSLNLVAGRSADYGVMPAWGYGVLWWQVWGWATLPVAALALAGARRHPALLVAALVTIAVHTLIPHKEYRFVLLASTLLVVLAAIGSVDAVRALTRRPAAMAGLGLAWLMLSGACGALGIAASEWGGSGRVIAAWHVAGNQPHVCGVAAYRTADPLIASYALYRRDTPIYQYDDAATGAAAKSRAFDVMLAPAEHAADLPEFRQVTCDGRQLLCVYRRAGGCTASAADRAYLVDAVLARRDL